MYESCELLVVASYESLRVVASYCELPSPHFCYYCFIVTIVLLLHAIYIIFSWSRAWSCTQTSDIFTSCLYFPDHGSMDQGHVDHGSQSFGGNGNSVLSGNVTHWEYHSFLHSLPASYSICTQGG